MIGYCGFNTAKCFTCGTAFSLEFHRELSHDNFILKMKSEYVYNLIMCFRVSTYRGEEALVFGPINREPDEKTSGGKGGVRKL